MQRLSIVLPIMLLAACANKAKPDESITARPEYVYVDARAVVAEVAPLAADDTLLMVVVDMDRFSNVHLGTGLGVLDSKRDTEPLLTDLRKISKARLGFDFTKAKWACVAANMQQSVTFLRGDLALTPGEQPEAIGALSAWSFDRHVPAPVEPDPSGGAVGELGLDFPLPVEVPELDLLVAAVPGSNLVAVGDRESLALLDDVLAKRRESLVGRPQLEKMEKLLEAAGDGDLVVAAAWSPEDAEEAFAGESNPGLLGASLSISDRFIVVLEGTPEGLDKIQKALPDAFNEYREQISEELAKGDQLDTAALFASTYAYHMLGALEHELEPVRTGDMLVYDIRTGFLTHPVTLYVGAVLAVSYALSSFMGAAMGGLEGLGGLDGLVPPDLEPKSLPSEVPEENPPH